MGAGSLALQGKTVTQARSNAPRNPCSATQYWNTSQNGFSENFQYDNMNRLWTSQVTTNISAPQQTFTYDSIGDIASKTGVGTGNYVYPASGANAVQPHAVSSIPGIGSFSYDANGNMLAGAGRGMSWNSFDMPITMTEGSNSSTFVYGPEHQRTKQTRGDGTVIFYAGAMEADLLNGNTTVKTYWPLGLGVEIDAPGAISSALNWTHTDRLGSVVAITDGSGNLAQSMAYDAWGSRRDLAGDPGVITVSANGQLGGQNEIDNKGYTGQEMLDQLQLVHLNGRVYDPFTARFISADPEIQDPSHSQSYNRYSYVWNNPTNDTDPSGFSCNDPQDGGDCVIIGHLNATDASSAENGMFVAVGTSAVRSVVPNVAAAAGSRVSLGALFRAVAIDNPLGLLIQLMQPITMGNDDVYTPEELAAMDKKALDGKKSDAASGGAEPPPDPKNDKNDKNNKKVKPDREQKPDDAPEGTRGVDKDKRLDREKIHEIKRQIGAGAKDWVGIDREGNIWTNEGGQAANQGHYQDFIH
jgi:RHS repeat-associated protein